MNLSHHEQLTQTANEHFQRQARTLRHENRKLQDCIKARQSDREMLIMRQVDGQMRDLEYEREMKIAEVEANFKAQEALRRDVERERAAQQELLSQFGKEKADEVFAMYPRVWDPLEKRKNYRNYS